jgi:RHS repeat-associated protein
MGRSVSEVKLKQYRYSGKERDSVTGFYYYGARYYVPCLGRWMSADPAGTIDGLNLYAFVESNPINHTDIGGYAKENKNKNKKTTKNKKLTVNKNSSGFKFSGRPAFDSAAKKIKVKKGQDRRHVIGYDDVIKPSFEKIINLVIGKVGEAAFRKLQSKLYTKHKITRAPKESAAVEKHLIFGLTKLNSTPGNLNPEAADENQAIEHVRQQGLRINQKLGEAFSSTTPDTPTVKKILKEGFAISGGGTPITDFADKIRKITHERIDKATNVTQLVSVLNETIASTGIDLNKASGSKAQTAFALGYISKAQEAADIESQLTPEQRLEAVWKLREIPQ